MRRLGWFDIKTRFKYFLRSIFYSGFVQELACFLISSYIKLVMLLSKKHFLNLDSVNQLIKNNKPFIAVTWHGRVAISSYIFSKSWRINKNYKMSVLASKHGDGMIIAKVMQNLGAQAIYGSTRKKNDSKKGIDIANFRKIFECLKNNGSLCLTPDGPRGPRFKVNGHLITIAQKTKVPIFAVSCATSKRKVFNSWDKFILPLPFSKAAFYVSDPIYIAENLDEKELDAINQKIEEAINFACDKVDDYVGVEKIY